MCLYMNLQLIIFLNKIVNSICKKFLCGNFERSSNIQILEVILKEKGHINENNMILNIDVSVFE